MNIEKKGKHSISKFYTRTLILLLIFAFAALLCFTVPVYYQFRSYLEQRSSEQNMRRLQLAEASLKQMQDSAIQTMYYQLENAYFNPLFQSVEPDGVHKYQAEQEIRQIVNANTMIQALILYNGITGQYYETEGVAKRDAYLAQMRTEYTDYQMLLPYLRTLPDAYSLTYGGQTVFTYYYYNLDVQKNVAQAVFLNIDASKACKTILDSWRTDARAYIVALDQKLYVDNQGVLHDLAELDPDISARFSDNPVQQSFEIDQDGEKRMISCLSCSYNNWILVIDESNAEIMQSAHYVQLVICNIAGIFSAIALVLILLLSKRIYQPIADLTKRIHRKSEKGIGIFTDELQILNDSISNMQQTMDEYETYRVSTEKILSNQYVISVLQNKMDQIPLLSDKVPPELRTFFDHPGRLVLLRIREDNKGFMPAEAILWGWILQFTPKNSPSYLVRIGKSDLAFMCASISDADCRNMLCELTDFLMDKQVRLQLSFISNELSSCAAYTNAFAIALQGFANPIAWPRGAVLSVKDITAHAGERNPSDLENEKLVCRMLSAGAPDKARMDFRKLLDRYAKYRMEDYPQYLAEFMYRVSQTATEIQKAATAAAYYDVYRRIAGFQSIDDVMDWFDQLCASLENKKADAGKYDAMVQSVKTYLQAHFAEAITLGQVADQFRISQGYLSTVFRENTGSTMVDYLKKIRMEEARKLLEHSLLSVEDVMQRIGLLSESNFYKQFKSVYGITPNTYRIQIGQQKADPKEEK